MKTEAGLPLAGAKLLVSLLALAVSGCLWKHPAYYAPVWSPDGEKLYYVAARPDGTLTVRRVDRITHEGGELAASHLADPPVAMALSPQGDRVALAVPTRSNGRPAGIRLHVLSPRGDGDRVLWSAPAAEAVELCWTPDAQSIVVAASRRGAATLSLVPVATGRPEPLANGLVEVRAPALSADGRRLAFVARDPTTQLWSLNVLTLASRKQRTVATALFRGFHVGYGPAWSPDGATLAYVAERYASEGFAEIRAWDAATGRHRTIARTVAGACIAPAWSPKGGALAFVRLPFGSGAAGPGSPGAGDRPAEIVVADAAGAQQRPLVADGLANLMPAWSPDGQTIAFGTLAHPTSRHHVVRLVDVRSARIRLAEDRPENRFLVAIARHQRGGKTGLHQALQELPQIADPPWRALAHRLLAGIYARIGQWTLVARHAAAATDAAAHAPTLRLLAEAQMRLGKPSVALATAQRLAQTSHSKADERLVARLTRGIEAAGPLSKRLAARRTAPLLHRFAMLQRTHLGNPRAALAAYLDLMRSFPDDPRLPAAAAGVFDCAAQLPAHPPTFAILERTARIIGHDALTPAHKLLLAGAATSGGQPEVAVTWLERLAEGELPSRTAEAWCSVARDFEARARTDRALGAWTRAAAIGSPTVRARAATAAAELLAAEGRHGEAARRLGGVFRPEADVATLREAMRLLARGRLHRADVLAYGTAHVGQLAAFGFLDTAAREGEQFISGLPPSGPDDDELRCHLATAFRQLAAYHLARDEAVTAQRVVRRWLRWASADADLPAALMALADCHEATRQRRPLVEALTRVALEFPDRPEAADARRRLLLLDTTPRR